MRRESLSEEQKHTVPVRSTAKHAYIVATEVLRRYSERTPVTS